MRLWNHKVAWIAIAVTVLLVGLGAVSAAPNTPIATAAKQWTDVRTGERVALVANIEVVEGQQDVIATTFSKTIGGDPYVVPTGLRLILTGYSGRGGTVFGDYWEQAYVSAADDTLLGIVPMPATPSGIGQQAGEAYYWTASGPMSVAVNAGEGIHFLITHAMVDQNTENSLVNANFQMYLTGYLVTTS